MPQTAPRTFIELMGNRTKARLFLLQKLPAAYFSGVRIETVSAESCTTSVPFRWFTQNPFRSTYFACLAMAAEMSTGALAMAAVYGRKPPVALLITHMESRFFKKATGKTLFTCTGGLLLQEGVEKAIKTKTPQEVSLQSTGRDGAGNSIADFWFTWSFKTKA